MLNNADEKSLQCPGTNLMPETSGLYKKVRPARPQLVCARSVLATHEHEKLAIRLREAARAKAENAAGGFFQQTRN